jgi:Tol biopolymer transport system component
MENHSRFTQKVAILAYLLLTCSTACGSRGIPDSLMYLSQPRPGLVPEVFAPGIVSLDNQVEFNITFTPDGMEIYFTVGTRTQTSIMFTKLENGHWTEPELAPFSREYANWSPFISGDGQKLYFVSDRQPDASSPRSDPNIWMVERTEEGWTEPKYLDEPINSFDAEYTPFVASDGTLYFLSNRPGGYGQIDIYFSKLIDAKYSTVENIGEPINTQYSDEGMVMTQDGRYMILTSNRPGTRGDVDLYIGIRNEDGSWQPPQNLGDKFNTSSPQYAPRFSLDGKFFFFFSEGDMYWVDSKALDEFK